MSMFGMGRRKAIVTADTGPTEEEAPPAGFVGMDAQVDGSTDRPEHNGAIGQIVTYDLATGKLVLELATPAIGRPSTDVGVRLKVRPQRLRVRTADPSIAARSRLQRAHAQQLDASEEETAEAGQQLLTDSLRLLQQTSPYSKSRKHAALLRNGALMDLMDDLDDPAPRSDASKGAPPKRLPWEKMERSIKFDSIRKLRRDNNHADSFAVRV